MEDKGREHLTPRLPVETGGSVTPKAIRRFWAQLWQRAQAHAANQGPSGPTPLESGWHSSHASLLLTDQRAQVAPSALSLLITRAPPGRGGGSVPADRGMSAPSCHHVLHGGGSQGKGSLDLTWWPCGWL